MRKARTDVGATQAEIAEELDIATEVYGRMERGTTLPSLPTFVRITGVLGVSASELLDGPGVESITKLSKDEARLHRLISQAEPATAKAMLSVVSTISDVAKSAKSTGRRNRR